VSKSQGKNQKGLASEKG